MVNWMSTNAAIHSRTELGIQVRLPQRQQTKFPSASIRMFVHIVPVQPRPELATDV